MSSTFPDFEELMKLAKENPAELERIRQKACEDIIQKAPEKYQRKLRGLQFKIDMEREKSKNALASCVNLSKMMHHSFGRLRDALNEAQGIKAPTLQNVLKNDTKKDSKNKSTVATEEAKIIDFPVSS